MISEPGSSLRRRDVRDRRLSIIDVSSADDSLLDPTNPLNHQPLPLGENHEHADLLYTPNSKKFEDAYTKLEEWEREPRSNETSEAEKPKKNSKCNLRKSLAWDSAFFTSAGVLDPEELSSIIEGVEKEEKHHSLPGIQEDVYKSCDSISTLGSESLTLEAESLEGDLFEDVRASIQKSSNKKSNLASGNTKVPPGVAGCQTDGSANRVSVASRNKMKAPPASRNPSAAMQGLGKMTKKNPIFPQLPPPVATRRESSILKKSKVPGKPSTSSTVSSKRVSLGDQHIKAKRIIGDRVSSVPKASVVGGSRGTAPKSTISSKSPSGPSVSTKTKSATSTSAGTLKPPSSRSAVRTPSKVASTNKTEPGNSSLSGLMSVTKLSSSVSPASSISDWSSESSSSASVPKHMCNRSRPSLESSSSRKVLSDTDAEQGASTQNPLSDSSLEGLDIQHTGFINSSAKTAPGGTVLPPPPVKPSGLRLPSPKIGFFDGVKSSVRTPRGGMQPHPVVPRGLLKHGAGSPSESQNKAKLGKLQPARSIMSVENKKPTNQQNSLPVPLHESLDITMKTSSALENVKSYSDIPKEVQKETHLKTGAGAADLINDLHPLKGVNNKENVHYDDQVDCLSKLVGLMDINLETSEKFNGDSLSFSQNDTSFQDKSNGLELSSHKELIDCPKKEELNGSPTPFLSISPTSFDMAASTRRPFAVKDSFCYMDDSVLTDSAFSRVKPTKSPVPESIMKESS